MSGREEVQTGTSSSGGRKHMTYKNMTTEVSKTEYFIPRTKGQSGFLFGPLLLKIAEVHGVKEEETAENRMRTELKKWGYIKESRSELDYSHTEDVIDRYVRFLERRGIYIKPKKNL